ncbi:MAG TPA: S8 family serine peptidase [Candidatus Acidoferrum sp.]|jgi:subtilisin-like proprotein convertase family protein|nr:S8 family serine peptidase [Candidatus Acidoferrum sp.]
MRWRPWFWLTVSMCCFLGALYFWRLGDKWNAEKAATTPPASSNQAQPARPAQKPSGHTQLLAPMSLLSQPGNLNSWPVPPAAKSNQTSRLAYRLSNTKESLRQLARNDHAILLENALLDTAKGTALPIPDSLRADGDPGAYIVQARGPLGNEFRAALKAVGASVISYIPNNAYLVRGPEAVAQQLQANPEVQAVVPYEPYYKIKPLDFAVEQKPLPDGTVLNLLLFADAREATLGALAGLGVAILSEDRSPFGPVVKVLPPGNGLAMLARMSGVQEIEFSHTRITANDLSRAAVGVAADSVTQTNYMGLNGTNVLVAVADTGVDTNHPDLQSRVGFDVPISGVDSNGHGTHVAGIIAGDGTKSTTVTNAEGSIMPAVAGQFRGKAPGANLFSIDFNRPDYYLQETAGRTNAVISNNSWTYGVADYDLAAASYDAAVRDSVPEVTGSQSLVYVFPAGNGGGANIWDDGSNDGGSGGNAGTIQSPGTAKNVITVGAVEQPRNITNQTWICDSSGANCTTNQPWLPSTDSSNQVAGFSSRGNVGIGIEGDFGRFKPDVVAPGTFVVSTRSGQWDESAYYNSTNFTPQLLQGLVVQTNSAYSSGIFVPDNAVQLIVTASATTPIVNLPVTVTDPNGNATSGINTVSVAPPAGTTGNFWNYSVSNPTPQQVTFDLQALLVTTNDHGNFLQVLSNMNTSLGGFYRYESGTSMAAADASGTLALIQDYFQRLPVPLTNSPALMKALLINGARSLGSAYDFQVTNAINYQGWGQVFLPTTLPASLSNSVSAQEALGTTASMFVFDQNPTNALATGQSYTRSFTLSGTAQTQPLRVTLAWTDPPGDPLASIKLVNDLDLVVTNLDTGEVFFGNDIIAGNDFNLPWQTNTVPNVDSINNVENVYLKHPLGTNFSVTVIGHRVNVNAVTANPDNVVQDYGLVVSSGDGLIPDALTLQATNSLSLTIPNVVVITNQFPQDPENPVTGGLLLHQHVGANTPLLGTNTVPIPTDANAVMTVGMTNQWHFYVLSNDLNFTNASFVTFLPPNLAVPRMGVTNVDNPANATRPEADIDMYVSTDFTLTNLSTIAIAAADKSVGRGGTEFVVKSNAAPKAVYYVGIKSEDQQAAEYNFLGVFSLLPPSSSDTNGNVFIRGMPVPSVIPPGTPPAPQAAMVLGIAIQPVHIRRVVVTNTMTHTLPGGLLGTLSHSRKFDVLNNHTCATDATGTCITNIHDYIYEDNGEGNVGNPPVSRPSDGPGSLKEFIGEEGLGVWLLTEVNNFPSGTGVVNRLLIELEKQNLDTNGVLVTILPDTWHYDSIDVPPDATNLTVCVSGNTAPVDLYVSRDSIPTTTSFDYHLTINVPGACLPITVFDTPPLQAGRYFIGVFNSSSTPQTVRILATIYRNPFAIAQSITSSAGPVTIQDDAVTYAYITNLSHLLISSLDVGLLISDPRISDLAITLISPNGTRVLLFEDRGALSTNGLGTFSAVTNGLGLPVFGTTNLTPFYTNNFDDVATGPYAPGAVFDGWNVLTNFVRVYPELPAPWLSNNVLILGYGAVSNTLPTTNSTSYSLSFEVTHAPYLVGTVGWWPFDEDARDIFGGFDGLLFGNVSFNSNTGMVNEAFFGDGVATRAVVPRAPALDVGAEGKGFSIEGWIRPPNITNSAPLVEWDDTPTNVVVGIGAASAVPLQKATATFSQTSTANFSVAKAIDGIVNDNLGWGNQFDPQRGAIAAFQTVSDTGYPGGTQLIFTLIQNAIWSDPPDTLGRFRLSVTTDNRSTFCDGLPTGGNVTANWTVLQPISFSSLNGATLTLLPDNSILAGGFAPRTDTYTVVARTSLNNITGVRLEMIPDTSLPFSGPGREPANGNYVLSEFQVQASPILRGVDPLAQGVQLWTGNALTNTFEPGSLSAAIWDTNSQPHFIETPLYALTNGGWQHVALTFDAGTRTAFIYTNGTLAVAQVVSATNFVPRTSGDLYFGYHPGTALNAATFEGGLDEFGLYNRPLTDCEVAAIFKAQVGGKYGTNVLSCPVTNMVQLATSLGLFNFTFVNGLFWPNGPQWETNSITFPNLLQAAFTNGPGTNVTGITVTPLDPNATVDNFVLSAVLTNYVNGLLHFTEDTNVALVPIKFAPAPYAVSNFPPTLIFSNEFENATQRLYAVGSTIPGTSNNPAFGPRDWTVISGPVTVLSNMVVDAVGTNAVALGGGGLQCTLPTAPGHRYQMNYSVRGPGMVSWWNGDVEPLSQRAWDLIGGNNGAFIHQATNSATGLVQALNSTNALFFPGLVDATNQFVSKIEVGDPANLRLTNAFTIEGWVKPTTRTNFAPEQVEQILFRGDSRDCLDPYWLGVERVTGNTLDIVFHVETGTNHDCGVILETATQPVVANRWQHIAAVFERNVQWTNNAPWPTNQLRLYLNGQLLRAENQEVFLEDPIVGFIPTDFTSQGPFSDLNPAFSPGVSIGARSRADNSQEFYGYIDELSVYGRALTDPEIAAIAAAGAAGKADFRVLPAHGLAKLSVSLNDILTDVGYGDNATWTYHSFVFTALQTNTILKLQSLEPGTIVDGITLTELPEELTYLPEESLSVLNGEDGFGVWKLEMWDTRTGIALTNALPTLLDWQLNFVLLPSNPPPVIHLVHGIPYTNTLAAFGFQNFVVEVPQWATDATNILEFAADRALINPLPVGVLWALNNQAPSSTINAIFWPPVTSGTNVLSTNTNSLPYMVPGQPYYLTVTNPNPVAVTFAYEVTFDILSLTNCEPLSNFVWQAGIPRYFQFDVPTNAVPPGLPAREVVFLLTGVQSNYVGLGSNVTVVLSQHLPLPDLTHFDYISSQPDTNNDVVLVTTNTTPFPIQTNRWYVGVFNNTYTNVPFIVQACYATATNYPIIIPLTNGVPFVADFTNQFVAPPGPPEWFFFQLQITNFVDAVLFEMYNLSGDADLVLQRDTVPGMAAYFDGSFEVGRAPEQIVLRTSADVPDLRGNWFLGIFNNESTNVAYTLRAVVQSNLMLRSAQPIQAQLSRMRTPPGGLLFQWNSVVGEAYLVQFTPSLSPATWADVGLPIRATTPLTTDVVPIPVSGIGFYRVIQVPQNYLPQPQLFIRLATNNLVRISWSTNFPGETLQFSTASPVTGPWANANLPVTVEGNEYVVYDIIGPKPKFYRLIP